MGRAVRNCTSRLPGEMRLNFIHAGSSVGPMDKKVCREASNGKSTELITRGSDGSNPPPRTRFVWGEELQCKTGVYLRRWYLECPWFSVRLHHWLHSDDSRNFHDHPFNFYTLVLRGSYEDITRNSTDRLGLGSWRYRPATHIHYVRIPPGGCWTVVLTGKKVRRWGFWVGSKWKKANKYFLEHGKHVCD